MQLCEAWAKSTLSAPAASAPPLSHLDRCRHGGRLSYQIGTASIWFLAASCGGFPPAAAQSPARDSPPQVDCSLKVKGVNQFSGPVPEIKTNFLSAPPASASEAEKKRHSIYSTILLDLSAAQLSHKPVDQCPLADASIDGASRQLSFFLLYFRGAGAEYNRDCSRNYCAHVLSDFLQSAVIEESEFTDVINSIVRDLGRFNSIRAKENPRFAARLATEEAVRHLQAPDATTVLPVAEADSLAEDFKKVELRDFSEWLARQRDVLQGKTGTISPTGSASSASHISDENCVPNPDIRVENLDVDHHGWGHKSLILLDNVFEKQEGWPVQIENATLRALCNASPSAAKIPGDAPWVEMRSRLQCHYLVQPNNRWLVLFGNQMQPDEPDVSDMWGYAQAIAKVLEADKCVRPDVRVLVTNFLQAQ